MDRYVRGLSVTQGEEAVFSYGLVILRLMDIGFSYTEIKELSVRDTTRFLALHIAQADRTRELSMAQSSR